MARTVKISLETYELLVKLKAKLMTKEKRNVSFDEAIKYAVHRALSE